MATEVVQILELTKRQINTIGYALGNKLNLYDKLGETEKANEILDIMRCFSVATKVTIEKTTYVKGEV